MTPPSESKKYREIVLDGGKKVECEVPCEGCPYMKKCSSMEKEVLSYQPDSRSFGREICLKSTIFPKIETASEERARKLYVLLVELQLAHEFKKRWNSYDIAKNLNISVYRVRQRIKYLIDHNFISAKSDKSLVFSFGRNISSLMKYYIVEFNKRFGYDPTISPTDTAGLPNLVRNYSDDQLKSLISAYFDLDDKFLSDNGYTLRFFPSRLNRLLIDLSKKGNTGIHPKESYTPEQLKEYAKLKNEGKCTGTEEWAKPYEAAISSVSKL